MAALPFPAPGAEYGPCADESCDHADCQASRAAAACICRICLQPIGYERPAYDEWDEQTAEAQQVHGRYGFFVHQVCFLNEVDALHRPVPFGDSL